MKLTTWLFKMIHKMQSYTIGWWPPATAGRHSVRECLFTAALETPFQFFWIRSWSSLQVSLKWQNKATNTCIEDCNSCNSHKQT